MGEMPVAMLLAKADAGGGNETVAIVIAAVGLVLAAASLLVSWAALHATALKRATISMHQAEAMWSWYVAGWSALVPTGEHAVAIAVYAHNGGANAGILERVDVRSDSTLDGLLAQPVGWYPAKTSLDTHPSNFRIVVPGNTRSSSPEKCSRSAS